MGVRAGIAPDTGRELDVAAASPESITVIGHVNGLDHDLESGRGLRRLRAKGGEWHSANRSVGVGPFYGGAFCREQRKTKASGVSFFFRRPSRLARYDVGGPL
jgi:hypothetical protein